MLGYLMGLRTVEDFDTLQAYAVITRPPDTMNPVGFTAVKGWFKDA